MNSGLPKIVHVGKMIFFLMVNPLFVSLGKNRRTNSFRLQKDFFPAASELFLELIFIFWQQCLCCTTMAIGHTHKSTKKKVKS